MWSNGYSLQGFFHVFFFLPVHSFMLCQWILSSTVITLLGKKELVVVFFCRPWLVYFLPWFVCSSSSLRKHTYSNILNILQLKKENFQIKKKSDFFFHISDQNINCGYSLAPPRLAEAVLTSTYNLCFKQIRKIMYTL